MDKLVTRLQECINPFKFGKLDLQERMHELAVQVSETAVVISNWFDYRLENLHGDCGELVVKAYAKITEEFPDLATEVNWGYDDKVFNEFIGWHAFLTARESPDSPRILIDPGFQKVEPFDGSGYRTEDIEIKESVERKLASLRAPVVLDENNGTFLGIDQKTGLIYYIGRNLEDRTDDVLILTTYRNISFGPGDLASVDKRSFPISPCPEEIRKQVPFCELAYQLEKHVASQM
jgi:hypothetical protein